MSRDVRFYEKKFPGCNSVSDPLSPSRHACIEVHGDDMDTLGGVPVMAANPEVVGGGSVSGGEDAEAGAEDLPA